MKQFFAPYYDWEDFKNGMFDAPLPDTESRLIDLAISLLCDFPAFKAACETVIINWPIATMVNLTNKSCNRRAWLGQSACNILHGVPEICTRQAWSALSEEQRESANHVADYIVKKFEIEIYETKNFELRR